jgi:charged multivesicular body protein 2A
MSLLTTVEILGTMNRQMNLPALQRIAMEFEKENDMMDQRQEMMDDAVDDAMGVEDEEESEDVVNQVMDELGIDLGQAVSAANVSILLIY